MPGRIKVALVGIGKIALDQHVPAINASPDWDLAATVSRRGTVDGVESHTNFAAFLTARPDVPVVSLCMPPVPRFAFAEAALLADRHVMLEKPPGATLAEVHALQALAADRGLTLYATWHSRMAYAVAPAKAWLKGKTVTRAHITWREDVRRWHPGQNWVFEPGGMGVFDPGINALSILTEILPSPVHLTAATLTYPENCQTPIAADLTFSGNVTADFDWRQEGPQTWDIDVHTTQGHLALRMGGNRLEIDGVEMAGENSIMGEYPALYARMAELVATGQSEIDLAPATHVADAFSLGRRITVAAFHL
jgi:D-galactose 1-dehydrogenase